VFTGQERPPGSEAGADGQKVEMMNEREDLA